MTSSPDLELELDSWPSPSAMAADAPLPPPTWLRPSRRSPLNRIYTHLRPFLAILKPRLTWRYALSAAAAAYILSCVLLPSPRLSSPLPGATGPHGVGTMDVEIPLEKPRLVSDALLSDTHQPAFELRSVLFTLYYPISPAFRSPHARYSWIPKPIGLTARGYARFARIDNVLLRPLLTLALWLLAGDITIPAEVDAPLIPSGGPSLPVMVFSHGLASSRTDYTTYLGELASRGIVIAAMEHRDGSCPASIITTTHPSGSSSSSSSSTPVLAFRSSDVLHHANHSALTLPQLKAHQLAFRDAETLETITLLKALNSGSTIPRSTRLPASSLPTFTSRLDFTNLIMAGHSFGATSAMHLLKHPAGPRAAILLDPGKHSGRLNTDIDVPILVVHSTSWSRQHSLFFGRPHFDTVRDIAADVLSRVGSAWFFTSLGTSHPSVTDAPILQPRLLSWTTGADLNTTEALAQYVRVSEEFVHFVKTGNRTGLLDEPVTHETYDEWVSKDREETTPREVARLWQIHVSPASST